jgi:hypothetical protein
MNERQGPIFLDQTGYRGRRMIDALKILPVLALFLWAIPMLWVSEEGNQQTSVALIYLFSVWAGMIILVRILSRRAANMPLDDLALMRRYSGQSSTALEGGKGEP